MKKLLTVLVLALIIFIIWNVSKVDKIYGNDEASIIDVIHNLESYSASEVKIIDVYDFDKYRIASLSIDNHLATAAFKIDRKKNYDLYEFQARHYTKNELFRLHPHRMYQLLFGDEHEIAQVEVQLNAVERFRIDFTPGKATTYFINLAELDPNETMLYKLKLVYFNADGSIIHMDESSYWIEDDEE